MDERTQIIGRLLFKMCTLSHKEILKENLTLLFQIK